MDVIRIVTREPHGRATDVIRLADAFVRDELHQFAIRFWRAPGFHVDWRPHGSRANRIHTNAIRRDLLGNAFHHEHHAAFAGRIIHMTGPGNDLVNTAHADDFAGCTANFFANATTLEFANRLARTEELAGKIHVEDELPIGEGHFVNRRVLLQPGVVDENVNGAEFLDHL